MMFVWRIWYWINFSLNLYFSLFSSLLWLMLYWYCIDIVRRNSVFVTHESWRVQCLTHSPISNSLHWTYIYKFSLRFSHGENNWSNTASSYQSKGDCLLFGQHCCTLPHIVLWITSDLKCLSIINALDSFWRPYCS